MAWTAIVSLDKDKPNVGAARATWNAGEADAFTYSRRAEVSGADAAAFLAEAIAARDAAAILDAENNRLSGVLTALMNG